MNKATWGGVNGLAKRLKWILGIGAIVLITVFIAAYVLLIRYDYNALKPQIADAAKDATGRELHIGGDIGLEIGLTPVIVLTDIRFQNAAWGSRPELAMVRRLEVEVSLLSLLCGNISVKRLVLIEPDLLIETNEEGGSNLVFEKTRKEAPKPVQTPSAGLAVLPGLSLKQLLVERGRFQYRDGRSKRTYSLGLNRLSAGSAREDGPIQIALSGDFQKEPFEVTGSVGSLDALSDPQRAWTTDLVAAMLGVTATFKGSIKDPLALQGVDQVFALKAEDLKGLSEFTGQRLPVAGPVEISGRITDSAPGAYKISDLGLRLGQEKIGGSLEVHLTEGLTRISALIQADKVDLRPLLSVKDRSVQRTPTDKGGKTGRIFPSEPLPLEALNKVEAAVKVRVGKLLLPRLAVDNLFSEITIRKARLSVRPLAAVIGGGMLEGEIDLGADGEAVSVAARVKADGMDLEAMLRELGVSDVLGGNLHVDVDVRGRGKSVGGVMADLDGHSVVISDGCRVRNQHIELLGADLSAGFFRLFNPVKEKGDYTDVNCFVSRFDIQNGLAKCTALVFDTTHMTVVGDGTIDLKTETMDISLLPRPKEEMGGTGIGMPSMSLGELARPFKLAGTLADPSLAVDTTRAALALGKAAAGTLLFGPVGIAAALVHTDKGVKNPCLAAVEAARKGVRLGGEEKGLVEKTTEAVQDTVRDVGRKLKRFFNR